jgi:heme-degrading monooxygenase HmoA
MYARLTAVRIDPAKIDLGIANFKEKLVPVARTAPGYASAFLLIDRQTGEGGVVTYWETLADMNAAEQMGQQVRRESSEATRAEVIDVDRFELVLVDRIGEPRVPAFSRVNQLYADPGRIDEGIAFLRDRAIPNLRMQDGYLSLLMGVNRMTGRCLVTSNWASDEARAASEVVVTDQRREAMTIAGAKQVDVTLFEIVYLDINRVPTPS